jgi:hypothetical protein
VSFESSVFGSLGGGAVAFVDLSDAPNTIVPIGVVCGNAAGDALVMRDVLTIADNGNVFLTTTGAINVGFDDGFDITGNIAGAYFYVETGATAGFDLIGKANSSVDTTGNLRLAGATGIVMALSSGNLVVSGIPTSNPAVAGALWNDAGTLKISAG